MRLVRLRAPGGLGNLDLVEEDPPQPGPGELLVRIRACALNMRDDFAVQGKMPLADGRVPLSDGAGEVIALGDGVDALRPGDSVVSVFYPWWLGGDMTPCTRRDIPGDSFDGFASEYVCMPAHAFTRAPAGYTHVEAASLTCTGVTAWRGLIVCGKVKPGDAVLVLGSGSVSLFALQFAKAAGARVIATSSDEQKLERQAPRSRRRHQLQVRPGLGPQGQGSDGRARRRSRDRGRRTRHAGAVDYRLPHGRSHRAGRRPDRLCGGSVYPRPVFQPDPHQRHFHRQPGRPGGYDPGDRDYQAEARHRPPFSAAGHRHRLRALRIPKAFRQGLP